MHLVDDLVADGHGRDLAAVELGELEALEVAGVGQDVVARVARLGHLDVDAHRQLQVGQALLQVGRVGIARHHVGVVEEHALHLAFAGKLRGVDVDAHAGQGQRVLGLAGDLRLDLGHGRELGLVHVAGLDRRAEQGAALLVPAAQKAVEAGHGAGGLAGVGVAAAIGAAPAGLDAGGRGALGELHRDALDVDGLQAGDLSCPLGRVLSQGGGPLVEAGCLLGHELLVVQAAVDEHVAHGQHQRQVGARVDGQPLVGEGDGVVQARVDQHDVRAVLVRLLQGVQLARADGVGVAAADEHAGLGVLDVGQVVARADDLREAGVLRHVAGGAVRVHVGAAERLHEALGVIGAGRARVLDHGQGLGAVGADDGLDLLGDLGVGLVPADLLELALGVLLQGVGQAVLGVGDGRVAVCAAAQRALAVGMAGLADHLGELAVDHVPLEPALGRAGVAQRVSGVGFHILRPARVSLLPGAEAHEARAGRHCCDPGAAGQKASPGNSVF